MEPFLAMYFDMGLNDCDLDIIDDANIRVMSSGKFTITASLNLSSDGGILTALTRFFTVDKWSVRIIINESIAYELKLDTARYLTKQMDVEPGDILNPEKEHILTGQGLAELIRCLTEPNYLRAQLQELVPGYVPVKCQDSLKESQDAFTRMLSTHASEWS